MAVESDRPENQEHNSDTLLLELVNLNRLLVATNEIQQDHSDKLLWELVNMTRILATANGVKDEQIAELQLQVAQQREALHVYQHTNPGVEKTQLQWQWGQAKLPLATASYLPSDEMDQKMENVKMKSSSSKPSN